MVCRRGRMVCFGIEGWMVCLRVEGGWCANSWPTHFYFFYIFFHFVFYKVEQGWCALK